MSAEEAPQGGVVGLLSEPAFAGAFAVTAIGALFGEHLITSLIGAPGYDAVMVGLVVLGAAVLVTRRGELTVAHFMPSTLVALLTWFAITIFWSSAPAATVTGWLALAAPAFLAIVVAHTRDTLQTVRAVGDVLRVLLVGSLLVEVLSGVLIDTPIPFLGVTGDLALGGPIQGLFGTRTRLGLVAVIAVVTFVVEWRTRSVPRGLAIASISVAGILALFTDSPIVLVLAFLAALAAVLLEVIRGTPRTTRRRVQWAMVVSLVVGAVVVYAARRPLVYALNAEPEFFVRSRLWNAILNLVESRPVQGWGWVGAWPPDQFPYTLLDIVTGATHRSALNAGVDVLLQTGWAGVALFAAFTLVALVRAWLTAGERRSDVYVWPALVLITLLAEAVAGVGILSGFGFFLAVVCATRASLVRGWRVGRDQPERPVAPWDALGPGR